VHPLHARTPANAVAVAASVAGGRRRLGVDLLVAEGEVVLLPSAGFAPRSSLGGRFRGAGETVGLGDLSRMLRHLHSGDLLLVIGKAARALPEHRLEAGLRCRDAVRHHRALQVHVAGKARHHPRRFRLRTPLWQFHPPERDVGGVHEPRSFLRSVDHGEIM
jgi:hypothetical protein